MANQALGFIETKGLVGAIVASDAASKCADIRVVSAEHADGGHVTVTLAGDLAHVQTAVQAGADAARKLGQLVVSHVSANPDKELISFLIEQVTSPAPEKPTPTDTQKPKRQQPQQVKPKPVQAPAPSPPPKPVAPTPAQPVAVSSGRPSWSELEKMPVVKLRQFARTVEKLPIQGRQISMANKTELLDALRTVLQ